ncbi:amino acid adenylation domain-containing protein [Bacillus spizizenii]|nr:amino acid adenylation domain-containing protein [Bacillus spizizenii]
MKELFDHPTIKQLSSLIQKKDKHRYPVITKANVQEYYKASSAQKRMFALWEADKHNIVYNLPITLGLNGTPDIQKVKSVLNEMISRHEALRTSFHITDGELVQVIHDTWELEFDHKHLQAQDIRAHIKNFIKPFDLAKAPLIRASLISYEGRHLLLLDVHHIAADGVSVGLIRQEFEKLYRGENVKQPPLQYKDYSEWQAGISSQDMMMEQEQYWLQRFSGEIPILNIQTDYERPRVKSFEGNRISFTADQALTSQLKSIAKETGTTLYMVLLAVYNVMLSKYTNQDDIIVGTAESGRSDAELEHTVGMFVNTIALRNFPESHKTFREFLKEVKDHTLKDFENTDYQFESIVQKLGLKRDTSRNPLFDVMFVLENIDYGVENNDDYYLAELVESEVCISKFDLTLTAAETNEGIKFHLEYCSRLFKKETVERMGKHYSQLLQSAASELDAAISKLNMVSEEEQQQLLHIFNETAAEYPRYKTIHQWFEEQVEKTPEHTALIYENKELTYKKLNEKANSLARVLREKGVTKNSIVGILTERSPEMIIGVLGVLKAGGAYLPIDPEYPADRISYMLNDSRAKILLTQNGLFPEIIHNGETLYLSDHNLYKKETNNLPHINHRDCLAYVIYTSGTTGLPKGVMVKHKGVVNYINWANKNYVKGEIIHFPLYSSISFDLTVTSIFTPLISGNTIVIYEGIDKSLLIRKIVEENKVDIIKLTPTHLRLLELMDLKNSKIKRLIVGGEELKTDQARKVYHAFNGKIEIYNEYGPTEATVGCMIHKFNIENDNGSSVSIGSPADNTKLYILGKQNELLPIGIYGELCISGDGLATGYLNKKDLTEEKFVDHPFEPGTKMYKTGDLARWKPDGSVDYLGRIDHQVKIRGYRIETGEIENQLLQIKHIKEAVVIARTDQNGDKFLCGYVTSDRELKIPDIKEKLSKELPLYMVPNYIFQIESMPLSSNGKIDIKALPVIDIEKLMESTYEAPRNKIEEILVQVWGKILGLQSLGINDNYYEIGGDSIKSILIVSELQKHGLKLEVKDLMQFPRIKELSAYVKSTDIKIDQSVIEGKVELVPIQKWFIEQQFEREDHYNQAFMLYKKDGFKEDAIKKAFLEIVKHHDALRMKYRKENNEIEQWNRGIEQAEEAFTFEVFNMTQNEDLPVNIEIMANRVQAGMSLEKGILIKLALFKTKNGDHLLIVIHHLVIDGVSWRILLEDFEAAYTNATKGKKVEFQQKTTSFKEWAQKLNEFAESRGIQRESSYWKALKESATEALPKDYHTYSKTYGDSRETQISFSKEQTRTLLRKTHAAYQTQINDILLCSLGLAIKEWSGIDKILVNLEGHGREEIIKGVQLHRTVGWFTSIYPVFLDMTKSDSLANSIKHTKEMLRHIPHNGIGYGILRYLSSDDQLKIKPEISFNYLGEFGHEDKNSIFHYSEFSTGESISTKNRKTHNIEINGFVIDGKLTFTVSFDANQYKQQTIERFTEVYKVKLQQVIEHCANQKESERTPWDYGDPNLQIEELEKIISCGAEIERIHSLSPMQEGMLYNAIINPESSAYFEQSELTVEGNLNIKLLNAVLNKLIDKYQILRTAFFYKDLNVFKQAVLKQRHLTINYEDISNWEQNKQDAFIKQFRKKDLNTRFDLTKDCLIRVSVIKLEGHKFKIIYSFHHIIMDGWSVGILLKEIIDQYRNMAEGSKLVKEAPVPYSHYLAWLDQQDKESAFEYWKSYLSGYEQETVFPERQLKVDEYRHGQERISLGTNITSKLKSIAEANSITLNSIMQTAWGILLQKYNNANDVVFGSIVSGRPSEINGIENMVGLFINAVPIRVKKEDDTSFISLAKKVNSDFIKANEYSYCSLAEVQSLTEMKNKLINHVVVYENYPLDDNLKHFQSSSKSEVRIIAAEGFEQTNYDLELLIAPGKEMQLKITYNDGVYCKEMIRSILQNLKNILQHASSDQRIKISNIDMVNEVEKHKLVAEFNQTELPYSKEKTLQKLFEEQVEKTPEAVALEYNGESLTYRELNKRANRLARALREKGVKSNDIVPILVRRSFHLITGILAILKSGSCYLPLDPDYPVDRINYMLKDSKSRLLLTDKKHHEGINFNGEIFDISSEESIHCLDTNVSNINKAEDLAYVIYTSGSTGKPKGVAVEHRAVHNFIEGITERIHFSHRSVMLSVTTCSFDIFGLETLLPLTRGLKVVITSEAEQKDPYLLNKTIIESDVNSIQLTPSRLKLMLSAENSKDSLKKLKLIMVGGEVFPKELLFELKKYTNSKIYNMYGPTETTIWSSVKDLTNENSINVGRPIANTQVYILNNDGHTVALGNTGELCIAGDGIARGYLYKDDLTAHKFVDNPFEKGKKMYKTGDLARWLPNGELDVIGRLDNQVKLRGYRIELGEIESVMNQHEKIRECVAAGKRNMSGYQDLVLYYVAEEILSPSELIRYLSSELPEYMIPQIFMKIDQIPLTENGKINVNALPEPVISQPELDITFEEAITDIQKEISQIWTRILNVEKVGIHDNFFEAGGNSIKIVAVHNQLQKIYPKQIQIADLFAYPTIYRLSQYIESAIAFSEIAASVSDEIIPIEIPAEYFAETQKKGSTAMMRFVLKDSHYKGLDIICRNHNCEIYHVLLAGYVFLLAEVSQQNNINIQLSGLVKDKMIQLPLDLTDIENFYDIGRLAKEKISNLQYLYQYGLGYLNNRLNYGEKNSILPLFHIDDQSNIDYLHLYDLILKVHDKSNEVELVFAYNDQKINQSRINNVILNYMKLIEVITENTEGNLK